MSLASARKHAGENRPPLRPVRLGQASVTVEHRGDGAILMRSPEPLPPYPETLTQRLAHWGKTAPDRIFLAQRDPAGVWRTLSYPASMEVVVAANPPPGRRATHFAELLEARPTAAVAAAHAAVGPDTVAKILFTSGSTGQPKGVINTQRMLCSNQAMVGAALVFVG